MISGEATVAIRLRSVPRRSFPAPSIIAVSIAHPTRPETLGPLSRSTPRSSEDSALTAAVLSLTALAAALRFARLGYQGFWFDEGNTGLLVHLSLGRMLGLIPHTESTPPLYYCVAWLWARLFGFGEAGLRSLSAVAGVLTVPVIYAAGRRLVSARAGLIAAALTACNPLLVWYSQEARSYALLTLFCAVTLATFARALRAPSARAVITWAVACALALGTHYYGVVAVVPEAAWLLVAHRRHRAVQTAIAAVGVFGLMLVPLALSENSTGHDSWIAHAPLKLRLAQIIPQFLIGTGTPARGALKYLAMALALAALVFLALALPAQRRQPLLAGGLAGAGFLLSLAFVSAGSDALITRNILGLWPAAAVLLAGGLAASRPSWLGVAVALALCALGVTATVGIAVEWKLQRPDWRLVAHALGPRPAGASRRAILIQHYRTLLPLSLYLSHLRYMPAAGATDISELDVIAISSPQQPLCWWGAACNLIPSPLQARYEVPGLRVLWRRRVRQFTILRLRAPHPVRLSPAEVAGVLTATTLRRDELLLQR